MSNTIAEAHSALKTALADLHKPPYCTGTVPLDSNASILFYRSKSDSDKAEILNFNQPTDSQLDALSQACQPAPFGVDEQDVLNEAYRKAGKMEPSAFSTQFSPSSLGIVELIRETLLQGRSAKSVRVELYKLNVYGPGSFFKAHVDTPRSEDMFGSLVIVLPTNHEGGSLTFRHRGLEYVFDSAKAVALQENTTTPHVAYVAFYSDVEHEVSIVKSGYRVTLTYNLYWAKDIQPPSDNILINDARDRFKSAFDTLLKSPEFLPKGGFVGFGLAHQYPFATHSGGPRVPSRKMSEIEDELKGMDAIFKPMLSEARRH
ncbi:hypothetical protein M413DRAFT_324542 [Hebeloma cylindrosporum]|uniref:Fe2OG dioxygenase domain-containing protein n=1 Tax=Hebeloma cylindrosporum TaxID=76867 RepID=A0A0C3BUW8_HEBCY|nr:hypothetical protein M413DRAFT_324542 [Hebeloma cylindrosporum h7]